MKKIVIELLVFWSTFIGVGCERTKLTSEDESDMDTEMSTAYDDGDDPQAYAEDNQPNSEDRDTGLDMDTEIDSGEYLDCPDNPGDIFEIDDNGYYYTSGVVEGEKLLLYFGGTVGGKDGNLFTWRETDEAIPVVSRDCMKVFDGAPDEYTLGINPRPGSYVLKPESAEEYYAILPGNVLAKVLPKVVSELYDTPAFPSSSKSDDARVVEVVDVYLTNFLLVEDVMEEVRVHPGMVFQIQDSEEVYYAWDDATIRELTGNGFEANFFQERFVRVVPASAVSNMEVGDPIVELIPEISDPFMNQYNSSFKR